MTAVELARRPVDRFPHSNGERAERPAVERVDHQAIAIPAQALRPAPEIDDPVEDLAWHRAEREVAAEYHQVDVGSFRIRERGLERREIPMHIVERRYPMDPARHSGAR